MILAIEEQGRKGALPSRRFRGYQGLWVHAVYFVTEKSPLALPGDVLRPAA